VYIYGDGETSRDFCYVDNAVQANLLAAVTEDSAALNQVYNVSVGERTTLNELFELERTLLMERCPQVRECRPQYREFRAGDVRHSQADISKARKFLGYAPTHRVGEGLKEAMDWYIRNLSRRDWRAGMRRHWVVQERRPSRGKLLQLRKSHAMSVRPNWQMFLVMRLVVQHEFTDMPLIVFRGAKMRSAQALMQRLRGSLCISYTGDSLLHMMFKLDQCAKKNLRKRRGFACLAKVVAG
jgi:hypothetical protein